MMIKKISLIITAISLVSVFLLASASLASTYDEVIKGFNKTGQEAGYPTEDSRPETGFTTAWAIYVTNFAVGAGAAFFMVLIIYGGWIWLTAQGNDEKVNRAKNLIIGSVVGFTILIAGRLIAELIIYYMGKSILPGA